MDLCELTDQMLFGKLEALAETERFSLVDFLVHLGEIDRRNACERTAYGTSFAYLTRRLGLAESDAVRRVRAARAARKYPSIRRMLAGVQLNLISVSLLYPVLTPSNYEPLLRKASRRSTREIEKLVAELLPQTPTPRDQIRALPAGPAIQAASASPAQAQPAQVDACEILSAPPPIPEPRFKFTFTATEELRDDFDRARDLLRHRFPQGRMEEVIGEALRRLVQHETAAGKRPRLRAAPDANSRRIPKRIQDEVWRRDGGRCAFIDDAGQRCCATAWLELDHIRPSAFGGKSNDAGNIRLLCRTHNQAEARRVFGLRASM